MEMRQCCQVEDGFASLLACWGLAVSSRERYDDNWNRIRKVVVKEMQNIDVQLDLSVYCMVHW